MLAVCIGMLRSGSTLQYNIISGIVECEGAGRREGYFDGTSWPTAKKKFLRWCKDSSWHVIKAHDWLPFDELPNDRVRFFYTRRDPLEVANSAKRIWNSDVDSIISSIEKSAAIYGLLKLDPRALLVTYEVLTNARGDSIHAAAKHLGINLSRRGFLLVFDDTDEDVARRSIEKRRVLIWHATLRSLKEHGITSAVGKALRALGLPESFYLGLRRMIQPHAQKTLYHSDHISKQDGFVLTEEEVCHIKAHFNGTDLEC